MVKLKRRGTADLAEQVESFANRKPIKKREGLVRKDFISTGSTLLNLALTDDPYCGFKWGSFNNIVGDSSSGKTFLLLTIFAEVLYSKYLAGYRTIYDEPEQAFAIAEKLFGKKFSKVERDILSYTIQDWKKNVLKAIAAGTPFIYGLDSFDSLTSEEELKRAKELVDKGKDEGSYKLEKPKMVGEICRIICGKLKKAKSLMLVISQTRQKIGVTFGEKKTRSGGDALRFYSSHEVWLSVLGHIKKKDMDIGVSVLAKVKKNKITGKLRTVPFQIYFDYGVDDVGSMIDWMLENGFWRKKTKVDEKAKKLTKEEKQEIKRQLKEEGKKVERIGLIDTRGDFINDTRDSLIKHIEGEGLENKLKEIVGECWNEIESELASDRKPKYGGA